ncbi:MAG: tetratricopeptide repeat protein [Phycisphaerales bacterium]|nr:MAG: tetratricopeptide repeat protein [Phycisphaerales bacterium]
MGRSSTDNIRIGRSILDSRKSRSASSSVTDISERNLALRGQRDALRSGTPGAREHAVVGARRGTVAGSTRISRKKVVPQTVIHTRTAPAHRAAATRLHHYTPLRHSRVVYHDRPHRIAHTPHYEHIFHDRYHRLRHRIIWPRYSCVIGYHHGPYFRFGYHYPYYHRKYVFVSLGGYWPLSYRYRRYYWYGYHPYYWYGYYPIARQVDTGSYNYYTYNYYNTGDSSYQPAPVTENVVFEQLGKQPAEPDEVTLVDTYFEEAVKGFEAGNYGKAVEKFARAMELAPDDMVLPFAYSQALMANRQYSQAAEVLRAALTKVKPDKEGVFYPRGLYPKEEVLVAQIDDLAEKAELFSSDADLQLLLGYQLLGIGQVDQALAPLMFASKDMVNAEAAGVLLKLLEKIKISNAETDSSVEGVPPSNSQRDTLDTATPGTVPAPSQPMTPAPAPTPSRSPIEVPFGSPPQSKATIEPIATRPSAVVSREPKYDIPPTRHEKGILVATLCAVGAGVGLRHFSKC